MAFPKPKHCFLILAIGVLIAFGRLGAGEFTYWDDNVTVASNPNLNPPNAPGIADYWRKIAAEAPMAIYIPLTYTVWGLLASIAYLPTADEFGFHLNPYIFHGANIAVHLLTALAAFQLLRLLIRNDRAALLGALFYALHPLMAEPVGWISGMKDVLSGLFVLLAALNYLRFAQPRKDQLDAPRLPSSAYYALTLLCAALAMLSKPAGVVTPLLLLGLDRLVLKRPWRAVAISTWPFILLALPLALIARASQPTYGAIYSPVWARPFIALDSLAFYLYKILWPVNLGIDYGRTPTRVLNQGWWMYTWLAPACAGALILLAGRRRPTVGAGAFWFVAALLPMLGLVPFRMQFYSNVADHYLYTALFGMALILATILRDAPPVFSRPAVALPVALGIGTMLTTGHWLTNTALNENALRINPDSGPAWTNLGVEFGVKADWLNAERCFRRSVQINRQTPFATEALMDVCVRLGKIDEAVELAKRSIDIRDRAVPEMNWKSPGTKIGLATFLERANRLPEALQMLESALRDRPDDAQLQAQVQAMNRRLATQPITSQPTSSP